ncbi:MAG TPA: PEP-CTERM sorting domain-containing protein [Candidatus Methylacidiphilales bacterium]
MSGTTPSETRRRAVKALGRIFAVLLYLVAVSMAEAQIPIPSNTASYYSLTSDGTLYYNPPPDNLDREYAGPNGDGGGFIYFYNPAGGAFGGQNWGGEVFAEGSLEDNTINYTSYSGYLFQPAPTANDTAIIGPIATGAEQSSLPRDSDSLAGASEEDVGDYNNEPYVYQGIFQPITSFTVDLGGATVAETFVVGGDPEVDDASPNINLSGSYTSTQDAVIAGSDYAPVNVTGSSGGSFSTPFLDLYGSVNVTGGKLSGDFLIIDNQIDPSIDIVDAAPLPSTSTEVDVNGSNASIESSDSLLIGRSDDLPAELTIENEATGSFNNVYVGCGDTDSVGSLKIDNGQVEITGFLEVGAGGSGTLTVENGATLATGTEQGTDETGAYINGADEDDGSTATVDGSGSSWTNTGDLAIGFYAGAPSSLTISNGGDVSVSGGLILGSGTGGQATLEIESGGTLESGTGQSADEIGASVGDTEGSNGTVTITGNGSKWTVASSLSIGANGTGDVTIEDGGSLEVDGSSLEIGNGTLTIIAGSGGDSGNAIRADGIHPFDSQLTIPILLTAAGSQMVAGAFGQTGIINVQGGGTATISVPTFILGEDGGDGCLNVTGGGGGSSSGDSLFVPASADLTTYLLLTSSGSQAVNAIIGDSGSGCFNTSGGAQVTVDGTVTFGNEQGSYGMADITDPDTSVNIDQDPIIGLDGTGTVTIQNGAGLTVTDGDTILGQDATGLGTLYVQGTGTTLQMGGNLVVGGASTLGNDFQVTAGGQAIATGNGIVGRDAGSNGTIEVNGSGSSLQFADLTIGQSGTGGVTISAGGNLQVGGDLIIGQNQGATGSLTLDGNDTTFSYSGGDIVIGSAGTGTMTTQNGVLADLSGTGVTLGDENTGNGTLVVTDDSTQLNTGDLTVGGSGTGALLVKDGATLISGSATVGDEQGSSGTATVTGDGSIWTVSNLTVGGGGTGELDIDNGGTVSAGGDKLTLGDESSGDGTVTLSNAGSTFKFTGEIDDGENGKGVFAVQGGASFTAFSMNIGDKGTGNGTFNVDGSGTTAEVQQDFNVGESGTGALNVTNGAHLLNDADATLADLGGSGTAVVDGSAVWTIGGDLSVGHQGIGGLQVSGGSFVSASNITLGEISGGGAGTATVSGNDAHGPSALEFDNVLKVGDGGSGVLNVDSGAMVKDSGKGTGANAGSVDVAAQTGSKGHINVDGAGSSLSATSINVGGTATTTGGTGSLSATNGGSITASGAVTVQAKGSVAIEANSTLTAAGGVTINAGGSLGGGGTIHGDVTNAGTIAPGDPQTTTIDGNYTQLAGGSLVFALAGNTPGNYDQLDVSGKFSIASGATLELDFIDGYAPTVGQTFSLVEYGTLDPSSAGFSVDVTGLASGFQYSLTSTGTNGDVELTALTNGVATTTPEPSTWMMLLGGLGLLGFLRLRRYGKTEGIEG